MKLPELQEHFFDVLCIIDDICRKNKIQYYLAGGTELGAVRDGDFIPWDDDMDLKILAEDYPRFKKAMIEQLPQHMHFTGPEDLCPKHYAFYARIYDDRWLIRKEGDIEKYYDNFNNRVGTDIFMVCKTPTSSLSRRLFIIKNKLLCIQAAGHRYGNIYVDDMPFYKKRVVDIIRTIGRMQKTSSIVRRWYKHINKYNKLDDYAYRFACNYTFKSMLFFDKKIYDAPVAAAKIRGREFPVPSGFDKELSQKYGNYMTPKRDTNYYTQHLDLEDRWIEE